MSMRTPVSSDPQRREARVGKGRLRRVGERILDQRPTRLERTDAAAKLLFSVSVTKVARQGENEDGSP